jgi:hypothetical protein
MEFMRKRTLVIITACCSLFLLIAFSAVVYWGPQVTTYVHWRRMAWARWWIETPRPTDTTEASTAPGTKLSYFGYQFEVPWSEVEKVSNDGHSVNVQFRTGQYITFSNPNYFQQDIMSQAASEGPTKFQKTWIVVINDGSKYEHLSLALSMTPSKLRPFSSHEDFARDQLYLLTKGVLLEHSGATKLLAIQTTGFKGFEIDGASYSGNVEIILFDTADEEFQLEVSKGRLGGKLTQAELNRIIQSFARIGQTGAGT